MRRRFPEWVPIMDELGPDAKMLCIYDAQGNVVAGKPPEPERCVMSAGLVGAALAMEGRK